MRVATLDVGLAHNEAGEFFGVSLGFDFSAEHEEGFSRLASILDIHCNKEGQGIESYRINSSEFLTYVKDEDRHYLYMDVIAAGLYRVPSVLKTDTNITTAWDIKSFGISTNIPERVKLEELNEAIVSKNAALIYVDHSADAPYDELFGLSGLMIVIIDKFPEAAREWLIKRDNEQARLRDIITTSKLQEYVTERGKTFYQLQPRFITQDGEEKVRWWLNPCGDDNGSTGWYNESEIRDWADGVEGNAVSLKLAISSPDQH